MKIILINLPTLEQHLPILIQTLTPTDHNKLSQYIFTEDQHAFIIRTALLRKTLSQELQIPTEIINFSYGTNGKPYVHPKQNPHNLQFNLSHSGDFAALALAYNIEIGIDIESVRSDDNIQTSAEMILTPAELAHFNAQPDARSQQQLYTYLWSRKEAVLKCIGVGLQAELNKVAVLDNVCKYDLGNGVVRLLNIKSLQPVKGYYFSLAMSKKHQ